MTSENTNVLTQIYERIVRVETKIDIFNDVKKTAEEAEKTATAAFESTKSAHKRLDKIDKIIFWAATSIIGIVLIALVGLVVKN